MSHQAVFRVSFLRRSSNRPRSRPPPIVVFDAHCARTPVSTQSSAYHEKPTVPLFDSHTTRLTLGCNGLCPECCGAKLAVTVAPPLTRAPSVTVEMALGSNELIGGRWRVGAKLGAGAFGEVFLATDVQSGEVVAVKMEKAGGRHPQLYYEQKIYKWLNASDPPVHGLPRRRWYGENRQYNMLVMDCLGPSLEDRLNECRRRISLKSVLMIGLQALRRVQYVHTRSFLHRDLKPDNMLMGINDTVSTVYIVDFGLAKRYRDHSTYQHIPFKDGKHLTGTARYASVNTHLGMEQSRRDDLESLGYVLVYLYKGQLPWQGLRAANKKQKYAKISEKKQRTTSHELCRDMPSQVLEYFRYVKNLRFEDEPDYSHLRRLFRRAMERKGYVDDGIFDWMESSSGSGSRHKHRR